MAVLNGTIEVWTASTSNFNFEAYKTVLTEADRLRAQQFKFQKDRSLFLLSRTLLRLLLNHYLQTQQVELLFTDLGKPYQTMNKELTFNVSHSGNRVTLAFGNYSEIGVDIEFTKRSVEFLDVGKRFFSPAEYEKLAACEQEAAIEKAFFNCWTRKEAFIKAKGIGLGFPLNEFEVSMLPDEFVEVLATHFDPAEKNEWSLFSWVPDEDYQAALAVKGKVEQVFIYRLPEHLSLLTTV